MKTSDFDYNLPKEFIAQNPISPRDHSKLMVYDSSRNEVYHKRFFNVVEYLRAGDVLVVNRSRVIPARIRFNGKEVFLLKKLDDVHYCALVRPGKYFRVGREFNIKNVFGKVTAIESDGTRIIEFKYSENLDKNLEELGEAPFPPYITKTFADFNQYQTVYAREKGSVASPTAGLHFTEELLEKVKKSGVKVEELILHIGLGTFKPVEAENITDHVMHEEEFVFSKENADILNSAKKDGRRIIAVGTTSVRVLETCCEVINDKQVFVPKTGKTDIFIYPGYKWKTVNVLITNFHLPKSTLLMLVASFLENKGVKNPVAKLLELYELAKQENYRFYSFGDAMLII